MNDGHGSASGPAKPIFAISGNKDLSQLGESSGGADAKLIVIESLRSFSGAFWCPVGDE